jgi:hypothetical protein
MNQIMKRWAMAAAAAGLVFTLAGGASAAEITLLCSNALKSVVEELGPQFEKATGHKLKAEYGSTGPLKAQIEKGQVFDVAILGVEATDDLIKRGLLAAGSRADIARSGMGVAIRKGAAKPDLGTTEAFKQSLLKASTIAYSDGGLTGIYLKGLLSGSGAEELKPASAARARWSAKGSRDRLTRSRSFPRAGRARGPAGGVQRCCIFPAAGAPLRTGRQGAQVPQVAGRGGQSQGAEPIPSPSRQRVRIRAQLRMPLWNELRSNFSLGECTRSSSRAKPTISESMPSTLLKSPTIGIDPPAPIMMVFLPHSAWSAARALSRDGLSNGS